ELARACGGQLSGPSGLAIEAVSTDSRKLAKGSLFVAVRGDNFDGHDFVPDAVAHGAAAVLVARAPAPGVPAIVAVDTVLALGELARAHRAKFAGPVVAITGSN